MKFQLKNAISVGEVRLKDENNSFLFLNITVGVADCPYDMVETKTVEYVFSNALTIFEARAGVTPFAEKWVETNYPAI